MELSRRAIFQLLLKRTPSSAFINGLIESSDFNLVQQQHVIRYEKSFCQ